MNKRLETRLESIGDGLFLLGIVIGLGAIVASGFITKDSEYDRWGENGLSWPLVAISLASIIGGFVEKLVCEFMAELLRILKKRSGLPYDGMIS